MSNRRRNIIHTIILFTGMMVFFLPNELYSQNNSVLDSSFNYKVKNITLLEGLEKISKTINYEFSYNADLIDSERKLKVDYTNEKLRNILSDILSDTTLGFQVVDKQIIIHKINKIRNLSHLDAINSVNNRYQIYGSVYDKKTGEPLAFANVAILGKSVGSVTNEEGNFNLKITEDHITDTMVISYIGYKNTYLPVSQLSLYSNKIYLEEDQFQIQEVVIRIEDPKLILHEALQNVKENYFTSPYYITAFYREIVTGDEKLQAITEAVIEVYKSPYWGMFSDQIRLIRSRKNDYYSLEDTLSLKLKGGLYTSLYLDAIKNPANFLTEEQFFNYTYTISKIVKYDDNTAYVINFAPKYYLQDQTFEGKIYINTDNLAIVAIEFNVTKDAIKKYGGNLVVKKKFGTKVRPTSAKYILNYRKINGKYFINLVRGELDFKIKYKRKLFARDYKTVFEFASNNIDTVDVKRFERIETISAHDVFIDQKFQYDHQFWGKYNYISPNETIEDALIRIQRRLDDLEKSEGE